MYMSSPCARKTMYPVAALVALVFSACSKDTTAPPAVPATIAQANVSNGQLGTVGLQLGRPVTVVITDASGNPVPFETHVTWALSSASGTVSAATDSAYVDSVTTLTDNYGTSSVTWILGTHAGTDSLTATAAGGIAITFTATAQPGAVAKLVDQSGNTQTIPDGTMSQPFVVQAQDQYGNPVPNVSINFTDQTGGTLTSGSAVTDANGMASVQLTAAASPATYTIVAAVAGQATIATTFSASSN